MSSFSKYLNEDTVVIPCDDNSSIVITDDYLSDVYDTEDCEDPDYEYSDYVDCEDPDCVDIDLPTDYDYTSDLSIEDKADYIIKELSIMVDTEVDEFGWWLADFFDDQETFDAYRTFTRQDVTDMINCIAQSDEANDLLDTIIFGLEDVEDLEDEDLEDEDLSEAPNIFAPRSSKQKAKFKKKINRNWAAHSKAWLKAHKSVNKAKRVISGKARKQKIYGTKFKSKISKQAKVRNNLNKTGIRHTRTRPKGGFGTAKLRNRR